MAPLSLDDEEEDDDWLPGDPEAAAVVLDKSIDSESGLWPMICRQREKEKYRDINRNQGGVSGAFQGLFRGDQRRREGERERDES